VAEAEATRTRSVAEAEATRTQAEATRTRSVAEADATRTRSVAEARRTNISAAAIALPLACGVMLGCVLAADFYVHENPSYIRGRMLSMLRKCHLPPSVSAKPPVLLSVHQKAPVLRGLPLMLLGPTGCGKSTLLAGLAREAVSGPTPVPTILVRLRLPTYLKDYRAQSPREAKVLMDSAARQVYSQIGYPMRRSLLGSLLSSGFTLQGSLSQAELGVLTPSGVRLISALEMLFSVCEELFNERLADGIPAEFAAPVLIFDELQDLIKDSRLKAAGGELVFQMLAPLIVSLGVDRSEPAVRVAVAGSSAELLQAFEGTVAKGNRWNIHTLKDPSHEVVLSALEAHGYKIEEAKDMVSLCGTRLRLLSLPLTVGSEVCSAAAFLEQSRENGTAPFQRAFKLLDGHSASQLAAVLDSIAAADAAGSAALRPFSQDLPSSMAGMIDTSIFYVNRGGLLFFQSQLQARVWETLRDVCHPTPSPLLR